MPLSPRWEGRGRDDPEVRILHRGRSVLLRIREAVSVLRGLYRGGFFLQGLLLSFLISFQLNVSDNTGRLVCGAVVYVDGVPAGMTDESGDVEIPDDADSIFIRALGYAPYSGSLYENKNIVLQTVPVPSGMIIPVTAVRPGMRVCLPSTTILSRDDMEEISSGGIRCISSKSSGIFIREYGGAMPVISFSIRGSTSEQIEYLVDGHSIESSMDGLPGLNLDTSVFGGLLISRGIGSGFSDGGGAGTVEFLSESERAPTRVSVRGDSKGGAGISGALTLGGLRTALSFRRLVGVAGTVGYDGTVLVSRNSEYCDFGFLGSVSQGETESPDMFYPTDGERSRVSLDTWFRGKIGRLTLSTGGRIGRLEYTESTPLQFDDTHNECGLDFSGEYAIDLSLIDFVIAAGSGLEVINSTSLGDRRRIFGDFSIKAGYSWLLSILAGVRYRMMGENDEVGVRLSVSVPIIDSVYVLHSSVSRGFRFPSMNELYWQEDAFAAGNPELETEVTLEAEIGIALPAWDVLKLSAAAFMAGTDEMIIWLPGDDGKWRPMNIGKAKRMGIEMDGWFKTGVVTLTGNLTLLSAIDDTPGETTEGFELPYMADVTYALTAECELPFDLIATVDYSQTGRRFTNRTETAWLQAYSIVGAQIEMPLSTLSENLSAEVSINNIFDMEYEESNGFSGKSRTIGFAFYWNE